MIYSRLMRFPTPEPRTGDPHQSPPPVLQHDEGSPRIPQAGVVLARFVSGADHLLVQLHGNLLDFVPSHALPYVQDRDGGAAKDVRPHQLVGGLDFAPAGHDGGSPGQDRVAVGETYRRDVVGITRFCD
jgi:hypothetical protein